MVARRRKGRRPEEADLPAFSKEAVSFVRARTIKRVPTMTVWLPKRADSRSVRQQPGISRRTESFLLSPRESLFFPVCVNGMEKAGGVGSTLWVCPAKAIPIAENGRPTKNQFRSIYQVRMERSKGRIG